MRVIAGCAKGHKLQTIEGFDTRPTTDRIKETLFNIIAFDLPECRFLDLFSGSGAIGIEALSRGAREAVFVDQSTACQTVILENLQHTKLQHKATILKTDVSQAIVQLAKQQKQFDMIFMDPPYAADLSKETLEKIIANNLLSENGLIVVERSAKIPLPNINGLYIEKEKVYKTTILSFLRLEEIK